MIIRPLEYDELAGSDISDVGVSATAYVENGVYVATSTQSVTFINAYQGAKYTFQIESTCTTEYGTPTISCSCTAQYKSSKNPQSSYLQLFFKDRNGVEHQLCMGYWRTDAPNSGSQVSGDGDISYSTYGSFKDTFENLTTQRWKDNISDGSYKVYGSERLTTSEAGVTFILKEYDSNHSPIKSVSQTVNIPFVDNPLIDLPVVSIRNIFVEEHSVTFDISTTYPIGSPDGYCYVVKHDTSNNALTVIGATYLHEDNLNNCVVLGENRTWTITIEDPEMQLDENMVYYLGCDFGDTSNQQAVVGDQVNAGYFDFSHIINGNELPFASKPINFYYLKMDGKPCVSREVLEDESGTKYGGFGVNAIQFSYVHVPITSITVAGDESDSDNFHVDIDLDDTDSEYISTSVLLDIKPTNWSRESATITVKTFNKNGQGNYVNDDGTLGGILYRTKGKKYASHKYAFSPVSDLNIHIYAKELNKYYPNDRSKILIEHTPPIGNPIQYEAYVKLHVPSLPEDDSKNKTVIKKEILIGESVVINIKDYTKVAQTYLTTTDRFIRVDEDNSECGGISYDINNSGETITCFCDPNYDNDSLAGTTKTVICKVGEDTYYDAQSGIMCTKERDYDFVIEISIQSPGRAEKFADVVPAMLTFESIERMRDNARLIALGLNSRFPTLQIRTDVVDLDVSGRYSITYSSLIIGLNRLESYIKEVITPVANYLTGISVPEDSSNIYYQIKQAIHALYPQYPDNMNSLTFDMISAEKFDYSWLTGADKIDRHEFIRRRYEWCNRMIDALNLNTTT